MRRRLQVVALNLDNIEENFIVSSFAKLFSISPRGMAIAGLTPVAVLFCLVLARTGPKLVDPCVVWSFDGHVERYLRPCPQGRTGIPESKLDFVLLSLGMPAAMLLVAVVGLAGAYRSERRAVLIVGLIFALLTVPMMVGNFGIATLISAVCFLISSVLRS
jgi:hypothetical protein